jgi:hypothetical protein
MIVGPMMSQAMAYRPAPVTRSVAPVTVTVTVQMVTHSPMVLLHSRAFAEAGHSLY